MLYRIVELPNGTFRIAQKRLLWFGWSHVTYCGSLAEARKWLNDLDALIRASEHPHVIEEREIGGVDLECI